MIKYESNRPEILPTVPGGGSCDVVECFVIVRWQRTETSILQYMRSVQKRKVCSGDVVWFTDSSKKVPGVKPSVAL